MDITALATQIVERIMDRVELDGALSKNRLIDEVAMVLKAECLGDLDDECFTDCREDDQPTEDPHQLSGNYILDIGIKHPHNASDRPAVGASSEMEGCRG